MRSITVVMTYFNRAQQLILTLKTMEPYLQECDDIVIVDDGSTIEEEFASKVSASFKHRINLQVLHLRPEEKWWTNPCIPYNKGFALAKGEIIAIQNAETLHMGDNLKYIRQNISEENYISFSCFATTKQHHNLLGTLLQTKQDAIHAKIYEALSPFTMGEWYNHPEYNPTGYHFLSAITRKNLNRIGGFNERFANGYCFDDNEFVWRLKKHGIKVEIIKPGNGYVVHQWHQKNPNLRGGCPLWEKNRLLFLDIIGAKQ